MEKLKIYSAYLPFELKCEVINSGKEKEIGTIIGVYNDGSCVFGDIVESSKGFESIKPILFSLEDLTKEITINGETFVPFDELIKIKNVRLRVEKYENGDKKLLNINTFSFSLFDFEYKIIEKLLEWKFNVFNLPEIEYIKVTEENNPYK